MHLQVDYYGAPTPLKSLAGVSAPESTLLVVQPYDLSAMQVIEKAIMASDLNLTPSNDGKLIRINIPALTAVSRDFRTCFAWTVSLGQIQLLQFDLPLSLCDQLYTCCAKFGTLLLCMLSVSVAWLVARSLQCELPICSLHSPVLVADHAHLPHTGIPRVSH